MEKSTSLFHIVSGCVAGTVLFYKLHVLLKCPLNILVISI